MSDHSELKRLAEAATQGTWTHLKHGVIKGGPAVQFTNGSSQQQIVMTTGADWMKAGEQYANADFIAAANPAAVLALIAENERLADLLECAQGGMRTADKIISERNRLLSAIPECPVHGPCVPYAIEWVEKIILVAKGLTAEKEAFRKDAERHRWYKGASDSDREKLSALDGEDADAYIDAAIGRGEQS